MEDVRLDELSDIRLEELAKNPLLSDAIGICLSDLHWLGGRAGLAPDMIHGALQYAVDKYTPPVTVFKNDDGSLYMTRYTVCERATGGHIYLTNIHRHDLDLEPHDHPWDMGILRLIGTYVEASWDRQTKRWTHTERRPGDVYRYPHTACHRIASLQSPHVWSLMVTGPYKHHWGFYNTETGEKTGHKAYREAKRRATLPPSS